MVDIALSDSIAKPAKAKIVLLFMTWKRNSLFNTLNNKTWTGPDIVALQKMINTKTPFSFNEGYTKIN
jgi:hypothetical protein